ncbi:histidine phosphatase family protein [Hydrogenovibrio sp. JE_KL2]|uniref:histidine phosphatase family protein n=1 Tax=Hydrogenovibrio sp. JE_KL2 TaxID=2651188 RepID=UPI00128E049F|nr:histidine phosphatase family protein [Hydrogenovibrio sp. JE_KL2]MPQ75876.1 histidine phosphatase family protein [Hydrogenovibrio sp. JE_KL2]
MEIILLRHGKPILPSLNKLNASDFQKWVQKYNASGLCPSSTPSEGAVNYASRCKAIVCSELPRSIESAMALNAEKIVLSDAIFNEAGLPVANWSTLKLSPKIWAVFFRVLWLLGYSRNSESFKEAKTRAVNAVKRLLELAGEHEQVLFVGHGVYNRILANELKRNGWVGPKSLSSKHWSYGVYKQE